MSPRRYAAGVLVGGCIAIARPTRAHAQIDTVQPPAAPRTLVVDERLRADAGLHVGDTVLLSARAGDTTGAKRVIVSGFVLRGADPSEIARGEYHVRLHLDQLQQVGGYTDRVDRFAVGTRPGRTAQSLTAINAAAFGFHAYRSADVAVGTSRTFEVVRRFQRAIGVITIVASAMFLLCILVLKVEERRRDVAALRLMGMSRRTVVTALVLEAALVALLGSAAGLIIGSIAARVVNWHYQAAFRTPLVFVLITPSVALFATTLSVVLGIGAGFLAARRLAATPPLALLGR